MNAVIKNGQAGRLVIPLLYFAIFFFFFGENIQQAPRTKIYETILCLQQGIFPAPSTEQENPQCKVSTVQSELAALKGLERLFGIIPSTFPAHLTVNGSNSFQLTTQPFLPFHTASLQIGMDMFLLCRWHCSAFSWRRVGLS